MSQVPELIEEYSQSLEEVMATQVPSSADTGAVQSVSLKYCVQTFCLSFMQYKYVYIHIYLVSVIHFAFFNFRRCDRALDAKRQQDDEPGHSS